MRPFSLVAAMLASLVLGGCFGSLRPPASYPTETFDSTTTHARSFGAGTAQTCEAARRALLSQGYLMTSASAEQVVGRKNFQPEREVHVEMEFRVVCVPDGRHPGSTIAFASALQDRYSLKKVNNSASVGVGVLGSVSLPFSASDDAMVKVASETLSDDGFYDRFYALIDRYLVLGKPSAPTVPVPETAPVESSPSDADARPDPEVQG